MKITFLIQDLFQLGAQYVTSLMIRGFVAKGYDVDLIVSMVHQDKLKNGNISPFEIPSAANIIVLPDCKARNNIKAIKKYLENETPNAIIAMSTNYTLALAFAAIGLSRNIKRKCTFAYVEHSSFAGINPKTLKKSRPLFGSKGHIISLIYRHAYDIIMAVSEGTSRALEYSMRLKPETVKTVYNPVIDELFGNKLQLMPKTEWLLHKSCPTFVAAAAHSEFKNHICLFEAIKIANKKEPVRLILFGEGKLTNDYKEWIRKNKMENNILLAGHVTNLPAEIKYSDAFIVSSNVESFSVVLVEALAAGVPVISTDCPFGPPEILQNGKYGTLVPVNDPQAMADAIINQIRNPRPAAPKESWMPYTLENVVASYEKALGITE